MDDRAKDTPAWLKHLQENSWEAEIIISGGALFSLFYALDAIAVFVSWLMEISSISGISEIYIFLNLAIDGLILGFFGHLVARSFWIGLACLNYAFPKGIQSENLRIQPVYRSAERINFVHQLITLDRMAGVIFWCALSFVLVVVGAILTSAVIFLAQSIAWLKQSGFAAFLIYAYLAFLFDLVTAGWLRRWKYLAQVYRPIYLFFNATSLAFLFRPWFQVLFSNVKPWRLYLAGLLFFLISLAMTIQTAAPTMRWKSFLDTRQFQIFSEQHRFWTENFYDNRNGGHVTFASIQNDIVSDRFLRVFIPYLAKYDEHLAAAHTPQLPNLFTLELDQTPLKNIDWNIGEFGHQLGLITYLDISELPAGRHELHVRLKGRQWPFPLLIPFWKQ